MRGQEEEATEREIAREGERKRVNRAGVGDRRGRKGEGVRAHASDRERVETREGGGEVRASCLLARRRHLLLLQSTLLSPSVLFPSSSSISLSLPIFLPLPSFTFSFLLARFIPSFSLVLFFLPDPTTYLDSLTCR